MLVLFLPRTEPTMKQIHVNIGLAREGKKNLTKKQVFDAALSQGLLSHPPEIIQSSTEPTYVAWFRVGNGIDENKAIDYLARNLNQEAIAWCPEGVDHEADLANGKLTGPLAHKWGKFDPSQYIENGPCPGPIWIS
jgi:hypothetical protein